MFGNCLLLPQLAPAVSSCPGGDPEVLLTVFDADYAGGNMQWCGETWTPAEIQAGTTKTVCPTSYTPGGASAYWGAVNLKLFAQIVGPYAIHQVIFSSGFDTAGLQGFGLWAQESMLAKTTSAFQGASGALTNIVFSAATHGTPGSNFIRDAHFGSHTTGFGVTYTWAKGPGWP